MALIPLTIGYVENYIGDYVVLWFYKKVQGRWYRVHTEKVRARHRERELKKILVKASLVPLARGT